VLILAVGGYLGYRFLRHRDLRRMVERAAAEAEKLSDPVLRRDLKAHADFLAARLEQLRRKDILLGRLDDEVVELLRACQGKVPKPHLRPGHHVLITASKVGRGEYLPTSLAVPEGWNGTDPLPLVLDLHAAGVKEMTHCFPVRGYPGVLCMTPLARGSHDYVGVQMTAVEECLADVRRRYPVSRLYVVGHSMGGTGAWLFAQRHVAEISGLAPWMGNADPDAWKGVWEEEERPVLSPAGRACAMAQRARMPVARVGQLAGRPDLPIYIGHGADDTIVPVGHSDSMAEKLRALGAKNLRYDRFDGVGHGGFPVSCDEQIAWLLSHPPTEPSELVAIIPPLTFVADMVGAPPYRAIDPLKEAKLIVRDGKFAGGENVEAATDSPPSKWHYPGPAGFAFEHPVAFALLPDAPPAIAECVSELGPAWSQRYGGWIPHVAMRQGFGVFPTESTGEPCTLIALGSPKENPAVKVALEGLDVAVREGEVRLFGHTFRGEDIGLIMLRPHPTEPKAATLVVWGSTPDAYRQLWKRFGHVVHLEGDRGRWYFDYAVFDRKTCGPDSFLAVGWFDHHWRFDPKLLFEGSAELRAKMPGSHWAVKPAAGDSRVWLSTLAPEGIESRRGPLAFDRSAGVDAGPLMLQGTEFALGIGMVPPANATWRLDGKFARFRAKVGLEHTGTKYPLRYENERVQFEVWADGFCLASSAILSATDGLAELDVHIRGAKCLSLRAANTTKFIWHYGPVGWGEAELVPE